jgi:uncharacterized membrane protein YdbT with pleckstrin-like domain
VLENLLGETIECPVCDRPFLVQPPAGRPLSPEETARVGKHVRADLPLDDEHVDRVIHPVVLRRHFLATAVCAVLLIAAVVAVVMGLAGSAWMAIPAIGLLIGGGVMALISGFFLAKWFIASRMQSLTLTSERLIYRYGIIHRGTSEMRYEDIRNMKLNQNIVERLLGFGDMALSSAGQDDMEIVINDIPRPQQVADYIRQRQG